MKLFFKTFLIFTLFILKSYSQDQKNKNSEATESLEKISSKELNVSLISLIANPEKYDGKLVQVTGFLNLEFEGDAIYLHQEDYEKSLCSNALRVRLSEEVSRRENLKIYIKKYVIILGRFKNDKGLLFSGSIENISRLDLWGF